jgi:hypothetical protein
VTPWTIGKLPPRPQAGQPVCLNACSVIGQCYTILQCHGYGRKGRWPTVPWQERHRKSCSAFSCRSVAHVLRRTCSDIEQHWLVRRCDVHLTAAPPRPEPRKPPTVLGCVVAEPLMLAKSRHGPKRCSSATLRAERCRQSVRRAVNRSCPYAIIIKKHLSAGLLANQVDQAVYVDAQLIEFLAFPLQ